jgi:hypothetical protein
VAAEAKAKNENTAMDFASIARRATKQQEQHQPPKRDSKA